MIDSLTKEPFLYKLSTCFISLNFFRLSGWISYFQVRYPLIQFKLIVIIAYSANLGKL